ncbi:hypothetical protein T484DRAFT_1816956 [Baffinella frigidus]|nr:hypothetical protein T484DRAFT_1816956 [Cryptophyta sp. CCMP2293]
MGRFTLSLILLALPAAISFVGVGPLPGPNFAPSLAPRSAPTRQPFTTPALSFAPRRPDTFHGVLGSTGSGAVRVWGGQVLRSSRHTPDQVELANRAMQGDGDAWMAAPSKEAADGSKTPNTMGTTGSRIDYQRKPETAKQASQEQAAPFSAAGNLAAQMRKRETAADDQREAEQNRRGRQRETAAEDQRRLTWHPG